MCTEPRTSPWLTSSNTGLLNTHLLTAWLLPRLSTTSSHEGFPLPPVMHSAGFVHVRRWMLTGGSHTHPERACVCGKCRTLRNWSLLFAALWEMHIVSASLVLLILWSYLIDGLLAFQYLCPDFLKMIWTRINHHNEMTQQNSLSERNQTDIFTYKRGYYAAECAGISDFWFNRVNIGILRTFLRSSWHFKLLWL